MSDISYAISAKFGYASVICPDVGPPVAKEYGWNCVDINNDSLPDAPVVIFDNRVQPEEIERVQTLISQRRGRSFIRIVDPGWFPDTLSHPWYKFAYECRRNPKVRFVFPYAPAEFTSMLLLESPRSEFVFAPYLYSDTNELALSHASRKDKLLISGGMGSVGYPVRSHMRRQSRIWPPLRWQVDHLDHPGYLDIGQAKKHDIVGRRYLEHLSKYRFSAVCSARSRSELLKYREFSYAGVVPVGDLPWSLLDCPDDAWIPYHGSGQRLARELRNCSDSEQIAARFRNYMRSKRDRDVISRQVTAQLLQLAG